MTRLKLALLICLSHFFFQCTFVHAGPRADHWSGFDIGAGNAPFPSVAGVAVGFNLHDDARLSLGIGNFGRWTTYGIDSKFFLNPDEWAAYIGGGLDFLTGSRGKYLIWDLKFDQAILPYLQLGADFQSVMGVHLNFNLAATVSDGTLIVLPGLAIGWYF